MIGHYLCIIYRFLEGQLSDCGTGKGERASNRDFTVHNSPRVPYIQVTTYNSQRTGRDDARLVFRLYQ